MPQSIRRWIVIGIVLVAAIYQYFFSQGHHTQTPLVTPHVTSAVNSSQQADIQRIKSALLDQKFDAKFWVSITAPIAKLLKDDREGSQHQRFVLQLTPDLTVLVAHNIDLTERVPVQVGQTVSIRGEYVWNDKGGVIHWTHRDPKGKHSGGWIDYQGKRYQ